jgi:hypothetical protein
MLEWARDPQYTTVRVVGPSEDHLRANLFSHLIGLHVAALIPLPGKIADLCISFENDKRAAILGTVIPLGRKGAGRLQGVKRFSRPTRHPEFGPLSRIRVLIDEAEKVPPGIWSDADNVLSNVDGMHGLKLVSAFNPQDITGQVAERCVPPDGWESVDEDEDEDWISQKGFKVVRLDAHRSENVIEKKVIYPGIQTYEGLEMLARANGNNRQSAGYMTFGRGLYPTLTSALGVIPVSALLHWVGEFLWTKTPRGVAGVDVALEGGDDPIVATGLYGWATGFRYAITPENPQGKVLEFRNRSNELIERPVLLCNGLITLPPGPTLEMASAIQKLCRELSIDPECVMLDRTGNGAGVHDVLKTIWHSGIQGINYSESASDKRILQEDKEPAEKLYDRAATELWFATRRWLEVDSFKVSLGLDTVKLSKQLTTRHYKTGKKAKVEPKRDYKLRLGESPNEADAFTLMLHGVRMFFGDTPSVLYNSSSASSVGGSDSYEGETLISLCNRVADLDAPEGRSLPRPFGRVWAFDEQDSIE